MCWCRGLLRECVALERSKWLSLQVVDDLFHLDLSLTDAPIYTRGWKTRLHVHILSPRNIDIFARLARITPASAAHVRMSLYNVERFQNPLFAGIYKWMYEIEHKAGKFLDVLCSKLYIYFRDSVPQLWKWIERKVFPLLIVWAWTTIDFMQCSNKRWIFAWWLIDVNTNLIQSRLIMFL